MLCPGRHAEKRLRALRAAAGALGGRGAADRAAARRPRPGVAGPQAARRRRLPGSAAVAQGSPQDSDPGGVDRKSVVLGQSVSVRVDLGGRRMYKTKTQTT